MSEVLVLKGVPEDKVKDRVAKYKKLGATKIEEIKENGTFTLKITFPDE